MARKKIFLGVCNKLAEIICDTVVIEPTPRKEKTITTFIRVFTVVWALMTGFVPIMIGYVLLHIVLDRKSEDGNDYYVRDHE